MNGRSLWDVLSMDERVIVLSSEEDKLLITWNQSDTFQAWNLHADGSWVENAILTQSGYGPSTYAQARKVAIDWNLGNIGDTTKYLY